MTRIHLLTTRRTRRAHAFTYPIRAFRRHIKEAGLDVRLIYDVTDPSLTECDVLGVVSDYYGIQHLIRQPDEVVALLESCHNRVNALIWFDVTDGTGTLFEPAFAAVDVYAKKQLLRDLQLYRTAFYEREYHLHYYYEHFGDELAALGEKARIVNHRGLENTEIAKFRLSWNIGLGDYNTFWGHGRSLRARWPFAHFHRPFASVTGPRPISVSCRIGTQYRFPSVPFHRREIRRLLAELAKLHSDRSIIYEGLLPYLAYMRELGKTQIAPSPFGLGEICWRDFEIMLAGALLFKPDMCHLETWPNYFEEDVTYVAHRWDFQDLAATIEYLLHNPDHCHAIAQTAQKRYTASISPEGGTMFAEWVRELVEIALCTRAGGQ